MKRLGAKLATAALWVLAGPLSAQTVTCFPPLTIQPTLPADSSLSSQDGFNCFGWQEFIALNWKAWPGHGGKPDPNAPPSTFGAPSTDGDSPAVVWESYIADSQVFLPNGAPPSPFGAKGSLPTACTEGKSAAASKLMAPKVSRDRFSTGYHVLMSTSKFTPKLMRSLRTRALAGTSDDLSEIIQAGTHSWLTAQNHEITFYEVRLNEDEYNYINRNKLFDANCQWQAVQPGMPGVLLPTSSSSSTGAIEVKAAWLPLTDTSLYPQYLTARAVIVNPDGSCQSIVVGLVGLHIIRKTPNAQQLAWATFEHIGNAPQQGQTGGLSSYTYNNPNCKPDTDLYGCAVNTQPPECGPGFPAPCDYTAPMQVVRSVPLPSNVVSLNNSVHNLIRQANPASVFLNYQLINVMWPSANKPIQPGQTRPLTDGNARPPLGEGGLANTTMETYFQTDKTCLTCHTNAPIASLAAHPSPPAPRYASDYSFLFLLAEAPTNPPANECTPTSTAKTQKVKKAKS